MPETHSDTNPAADVTESMHDLERQRRENRDAIAALGVNPYGVRTEGIESINTARGRYDEAADAHHQEQFQSTPPCRGDGAILTSLPTAG